MILQTQRLIKASHQQASKSLAQNMKVQQWEIVAHRHLIQSLKVIIQMMKEIRRLEMTTTMKITQQIFQTLLPYCQIRKEKIS